MQIDKIIIQAAGGLVSNAKKEILMIFRLKHWDLPKGKLENNETLEQCALREVSEECGITPIMGQKLCTTMHRYQLDGQSIEKHTTWFSMTVADNPELTPQTEEGIESCHWVDPNSIEDLLQNSYSTIRDVFKAFND